MYPDSQHCSAVGVLGLPNAMLFQTLRSIASTQWYSHITLYLNVYNEAVG